MLVRSRISWGNQAATSVHNKEQISAWLWHHGIHKWCRMAGAYGTGVELQLMRLQM